MAAIQTVFERYEEKYLLSPEQAQALQKRLEGRMREDCYGPSVIRNVYYDTEDYALIRHSLQKPAYKEKLRLRCYGAPGREDPVFLELKKKYHGVVYKRRVALRLEEAEAFLRKGARPSMQNQVLEEISWFLARVQPLPSVFLAYDRMALCGVEEPALRLTFDENIRWRREALSLERGDWGERLLAPGQILMEAKLPGAMPVWLSHMLSELSIFPISFSKYGECYRQNLIHEGERKGGSHCA